MVKKSLESCDVNELHAHMFNDQNGLVTYATNEDFYIFRNWQKNKDKVKYIDDEEKELLDFLERNELVSIEDNEDFIKEETSFLKSLEGREYQNKVLFFNDWSDEVKSSATGLIREKFYTYHAYKVNKNRDGKLSLEKSEGVDNLLDIKDQYPYFNIHDYCKKDYKIYRAPEYSSNEEDIPVYVKK